METLEQSAVKKIAPAVNPKLQEFQEIFNPPRFVKMGDRVQMAFGYDYANFSFVEGDDGVIVIDTGFYSNPVARALKDYRALVKKPIKAIVYTHVHYDHRGGSPVFVKESGGDIPIYAPAGWREHALYDRSGLRPTIVRRGLSQFGILLPVGDDGTVGAGIGPVTRADGEAGFVPPTVTVKERMELTICGVRMEFIPTPADIESNMMVWLPDDKVLVTGDLLGGTLPYVATARFEKDRSALKFVAGLDKALQFDPSYVVPGHGRALLGEKDVMDVLSVNRDACQFLADQVTRFVNKGYSPDQIIDCLTLPPHMASHPDLQPYYHRLDWLVRGLYLKRAGWVSDGVSLTRLTDKQGAIRLTDLLGGPDKTTEHAQKAYNDGDYRWAAQLANYVLVVDPSHKLAGDVQRESFRGIAYATESANERNYLLTILKEDIPWKKIYAGTGIQVRQRQSSSELLELMRVRFKAEKALTEKMVIGISIEGEPDTHTLEAKQGILVYRQGLSENSDGKLSLSRDMLVKLSVGALSWSDALAMGAIKAEEGQEAVKKFASWIDTI
ncbi:MAG: MBL fold metallo-hydrolase [Desulfatibacillum sp.]|nr:MBL fold metallo-hydrolase [Desulfatibacillum sp.]